MGIDPSSVNVRDLKITQPDRSGPGGDQVGEPTTIGEELTACYTEENRLLRRPRGRDVVALGRFFLDPILDEDGEIVEIEPGFLAQWTNAFGSLVEPQEIVDVEPIMDCTGALDIVRFSVGRTYQAGA